MLNLRFNCEMEEKKDMISKLPDSLISQILFCLPTKEAVRTSVLSSRWKTLWLLIPGLDLDSHEFLDYNALASFVHRCLDFNREEKSCLHKLKLSIHKDENDQSSLTGWIDFVATVGKLKHLDVECFGKRYCLEVMPLSLFICETLVYLRLHQVLFGSTSSFEDSSSVSLPRLKTMRLELNVYANETSLELLISFCPVLEDLSIFRRDDDNAKVLRVCSQTVTSLSIKYYIFPKGADPEVEILIAGDLNDEQLGLLIDAPRVKYLDLEDEISHSKTIINSGSLTKVNILGCFCLEPGPGADQVHKFFTSFSEVKDLKISWTPCTYIAEMEELPQFCNLSCLEAELAFFDVVTLRRLLESCPNLRSLILELEDNGEREHGRLSPVPRCFLSSLELVEINCGFNGCPTVEIVSYFAENAVILKKLVLRLREENPVFLKDVLALSRRNSTCQIIVC